MACSSLASRVWALFTQVVGGIADAIFQAECDATFQAGVKDRHRGRVFMWKSGAQCVAGALAAVATAFVSLWFGIPAGFEADFRKGAAGHLGAQGPAPRHALTRSRRGVLLRSGARLTLRDPG